MKLLWNWELKYIFNSPAHLFSEYCYAPLRCSYLIFLRFTTIFVPATWCRLLVSYCVLQRYTNKFKKVYANLAKKKWPKIFIKLIVGIRFYLISIVDFRLISLLYFLKGDIWKHSILTWAKDCRKTFSLKSFFRNI
jgi:hypothetical protein